jgi:hypothetical protein
MSRKLRWISNEIFDWEAYRSSSTIKSRSSVQRAYEYWQHSASLLDRSPSQFSLADAVANLKRALNHRLKVIESIYRFRSFNLPGRSNNYLDILETLGLVRPALIKYLLDVRNAIEHQDVRPPSLRRCAELLDMTWYFLRSTDSVVREAVSSLEYDCYTVSGEETHYGFTLHCRFGKKPAMAISGWFPCALLETQVGPAVTPLKIDTLHTKRRWKEVGRHAEKLDSDLWIIGRLDPTPLIKQKVLKAVLGTT